MGCTSSTNVVVNEAPANTNTEAQAPTPIIIQTHEEIKSDKYVGHNEAVIISCYFNPGNSEYRLKAFKTFYETIKHVNHRIIELAIGEDKFDLDYLKDSPYYKRLNTPTLLWHKEGLMNILIRHLPLEYKYVFWLDTDVLFTNNNWIIDSVKTMKHGMNIIQPFEYCFHLDKDQEKPSVDILEATQTCQKPIEPRNKRRCWRSFCANYATDSTWKDERYDIHGHVGFAWGAKRDILDKMNGLYDAALIGGADHIMAHAAVGQIPHSCIQKVYQQASNQKMNEITEWSQQFFKLTEGKVGYVDGMIYHLWHGDLETREYYQRILEFSKYENNIIKFRKDENGLYICTDKEAQEYINSYFDKREKGHLRAPSPTKTTTHNNNTTTANTVHINPPNLHAPNIHVPTVHAPNVHVPTVHAPNVHVPTVHAPNVHAPHISKPNVNLRPAGNAMKKGGNSILSGGKKLVSGAGNTMKTIKKPTLPTLHKKNSNRVVAADSSDKSGQVNSIGSGSGGGFYYDNEGASEVINTNEDGEEYEEGQEEGEYQEEGEEGGEEYEEGQEQYGNETNDTSYVSGDNGGFSGGEGDGGGGGSGGGFYYENEGGTGEGDENGDTIEVAESAYNPTTSNSSSGSEGYYD